LQINLRWWYGLYILQLISFNCFSSHLSNFVDNLEFKWYKQKKASQMKYWLRIENLTWHELFALFIRFHWLTEVLTGFFDFFAWNLSLSVFLGLVVRDVNCFAEKDFGSGNTRKNVGDESVRAWSNNPDSEEQQVDAVRKLWRLLRGCARGQRGRIPTEQHQPQRQRSVEHLVNTNTTTTATSTTTTAAAAATTTATASHYPQQKFESSHVTIADVSHVTNRHHALVVWLQSHVIHRLLIIIGVRKSADVVWSVVVSFWWKSPVV